MLNYQKKALLLHHETNYDSMMKVTEQTLQQIERALHKVADKFPANEEASLLTDVHIRVAQETGEMMIFDDDDVELTRCVVEQWMDNKDDDFYEAITPIIRKCIEKEKTLVESLSILKPYAFVLEDDDRETVTELYVVDDDTVIIDSELMEGLDKDLDIFFENLLKS
jgi:hypothetical protein